jgi:hypothetical protein
MSEEGILNSFADGLPYLPNGLIADKWGNLYGTTTNGGAFSGANPCFYGCGTVFELVRPAGQQTQWTEKIGGASMVLMALSL